VQILSNEKRQMFGEQKVSVKKRVLHRLPFSFFKGLFAGLRKAGARNVAE
jgi:hypothetical protein